VRAALSLLSSCLVAVAATATADDLSHVSDDDLAEELIARDGDIDRTTRRIAALELEELELAISLDDVHGQVRRIEQRLVHRVALLYRLSRHGAALRYLISAGSATELLKRLRTLRHLVIDGLEDRRSAGLRAVELEGRMRAVRSDRQRADEMLEQLEMARDELLGEQARRSGRRTRGGSRRADRDTPY
jgi:hypothetical protein